MTMYMLKIVNLKLNREIQILLDMKLYDLAY